MCFFPFPGWHNKACIMGHGSMGLTFISMSTDFILLCDPSEEFAFVSSCAFQICLDWTGTSILEHVSPSDTQTQRILVWWTCLVLLFLCKAEWADWVAFESCDSFKCLSIYHCQYLSIGYFFSTSPHVDSVPYRCIVDILRSNAPLIAVILSCTNVSCAS